MPPSPHIENKINKIIILNLVINFLHSNLAVKRDDMPQTQCLSPPFASFVGTPLNHQLPFISLFVTVYVSTGSYVAISGNVTYTLVE